MLRVLEEPSIRRIVVDPVGPDTLTLRQILVDLRRWLGLPPARVIEVPIVFIDRRAGRSKMSRTIFLEAVAMVWKLRLDAVRGRI